MATRMAELGVLPHVVEAVLNHVSGHKAGVAGVYNRATYASEKRQALELLNQHVAGLVDPLVSSTTAKAASAPILAPRASEQPLQVGTDKYGPA